MSHEQSESRAERWLGRIKNTPFVAAIVVIATISTAVFPFWDRAVDAYRNYISAPVSLESFYLTQSSASDFQETPFKCREEGKEERTFTGADRKPNSAIPLDFVFVNNAKTDLVIKAVDAVVYGVDVIAGKPSGVILSEHQYLLSLEEEAGTQTFPLNPNFRIAASDTSAFTLVFSPASAGFERCWTMRLEFKTNLGAVRSSDFSLIMSKKKPSADR